MNERSKGRPHINLSAEDPRLSVRVVNQRGLQRLQDEASALHLASWSSNNALAHQVSDGSVAFLCPVFRNGAPVDEPESYRCYIWFVQRPEASHRSGDHGAVSLIDVTAESFESLREVTDPVRLTAIIRYLLDSHPPTELD
ncbi:hypothetical protein AB0M22_30375 [Nocardia sp. NPDC051756]|uniref:hypothetical protein n=1 Tax=Nocardia sp. NPDC051756 TaxID=3154751 RepID=UPI0034274785